MNILTVIFALLCGFFYVAIVESTDLLECPYCIEQYTPSIVSQQPCGHQIHDKCLTNILAHSTRCPECRHVIEPRQDTKVWQELDQNTAELRRTLGQKLTMHGWEEWVESRDMPTFTEHLNYAIQVLNLAKEFNRKFLVVSDTTPVLGLTLSAFNQEFSELKHTAQVSQLFHALWIMMGSRNVYQTHVKTLEGSIKDLQLELDAYDGSEIIIQWIDRITIVMFRLHPIYSMAYLSTKKYVEKRKMVRSEVDLKYPNQRHPISRETEHYQSSQLPQ